MGHMFCGGYVNKENQVINDLSEYETKCTVERKNLSIIVRCEGSTISEMLDAFEDALRGCGFYFDGQIAVVEEDEIEEETEDEDN
jgi:hypothetical protein